MTNDDVKGMTFGGIECDRIMIWPFTLTVEINQKLKAERLAKLKARQAKLQRNQAQRRRRRHRR